MFINTHGSSITTYPCVWLTIALQIFTHSLVKHTTWNVFFYTGGVVLFNDSVYISSVYVSFSSAFVLIICYWVDFIEVLVDRTSLCVDTSGVGARMRALCESYSWFPHLPSLRVASLLFSSPLIYSLRVALLRFSSLLFFSLVFSCLTVFLYSVLRFSCLLFTSLLFAFLYFS